MVFEHQMHMMNLFTRIGWEARMMPGKTYLPAAFERLLGELPLAQVSVEPWQVEYDLAWARKADSPPSEGVNS